MHNASQTDLKALTTLAPLTLSSRMGRGQPVLCIPFIVAAPQNSMGKSIMAGLISQEENANGKDHRRRNSGKYVNVGIQKGSPSKATSPCAAGQLGASVAFKRENVEVGPAYHSGVKLGNEKALDVQGGGPGKGPEVFRSGSQGTHGMPAPGKSDAPRGLDVRGRGKDVV